MTANLSNRHKSGLLEARFLCAKPLSTLRPFRQWRLWHRAARLASARSGHLLSSLYVRGFLCPRPSAGGGRPVFPVGRHRVVSDGAEAPVVARGLLCAGDRRDLPLQRQRTRPRRQSRRAYEIRLSQLRNLFRAGHEPRSRAESDRAREGGERASGAHCDRRTGRRLRRESLQPAPRSSK
jgi:hypothetical protein